MIKYFLSFLVFFSFSLNGFAQSTWTNHVAMPNDIRSLTTDAQGNIWAGAFGGLLKFNGTSWTTYTVNNSNLSYPDIYSVAIDAQGNKWMGTNGDGVVKFDGTNWTTYRTTNSGLSSNYVYTVLIDAQGHKWLGNYTGLSRFDGTNWTNYNASNSGLQGSYVFSSAIDAQGKKWFGTIQPPASGGTGVAGYDNANWTVYNSNNGLINDGIYAIAIEASGTKWLGTYGMGLRRFDGTNWTSYTTSNSGLPHNGVRSIVIDAQGNKWIGTAGGGVSRLSGTTWTTYNMSNSGLPHNTVYAILIDAQGNKWFGTGNGIAKFDGTNWTVYRSKDSSLVNNTTRAIVIDAQGNKWFGTDDGVSKFNGSTWTNYTSGNSGLVYNYISSIAIDVQGNKWFGTKGSGVSKLSGTTWTTYHTGNSNLPHDYIYTTLVDAQGNKWFGTGSGASKFDGTTWTTYNTGNSGLSDNNVQAIAVDGQNNKWFGTYAGGICKFDGSNWTVYNSNNSGLTSNHVLAIMVDPKGNKWFGTDNGVSKFDGTTWTTYRTNNSGLAGNSVVSIGIDSTGIMWFTTFGAGISKFDGFNWTTYNNTNTSKGLVGNEVYSMAIESAGHKWFGTHYGVSRLADLSGPPAVAQQPANASTCVLTNVSFAVTASVTTGYQWQVFNGSTWANVANNTLYAGANTPVLSLNNVPASINGYQYRCRVYNALDSAISAAATLTVHTSLTPAVVVSANPGNTICAGTSVTFTATPTNGGTPTYQWKVNGVNAGTNSANYTTTTLTNNSVVTCQMTSSLSCAVPSSATSNGITMTVNPVLVPSVSIAANPGNTICAGASASFTATVVNEGAAPAYQWKVNSVNAGTNSATFTTTSLNNNDVVTCQLTSNATCVSPATVGSNNITMTVNPVLTPSVSITANPGNAVCSGTSITFTATPTNGGATPAYQWKVNGSNTGSNSAAFTTAALNNGDVVTCVLTSNANCLSTTTATSNSIAMAVTANVTPSVTIASGAGNSICSGTSVTFTAAATNEGATPGYQWKVNGVNAGTNSTTFITTGLGNNDVVTCTMTSSIACVTSSSATSNSITMTVTQSVTPSVAITASPNSAVCAGTSVAFTASAINGGSSPSYQWKVNGVNTGTNSATYNTSSLANNDVVTCVLSSNATCATPSIVASNGINATVNPIVTPSVAIASSPGNSICTGTSVTFTATPAHGGTSPSYQWKVNGINAGTNSALFTTTALNNNDVVTCTMTSNAACTSISTATATGITMTVNPFVTPAVSISSNSGNTICAGTPVIFTASPVNGGAAPSYQWKVNGLNAGTNSASYNTSSLANNDVVTCELMSNANCLTSPTTASNSISMTVNPVLTPSVTIAATPGNSICDGMPVAFTATPVNEGSSPLYQWKVNGTNVGTSSTSYTTATLSNNDVVTCELTSSVTCPASATATSAGVTMTVLPYVKPTVTITATPGINVGPYSQISFTTAVTNEGTAPGYQWKKNGIDIANATGSTYTGVTGQDFTTNDKITVVLTSNAACVDPADTVSNELTINVDLNVVSLNNKHELSLSPNPNAGIFHIKGRLKSLMNGKVMFIEVSDLLGRRIHSMNMPVRDKDFDIEIKLPGQLTEGTYLLRLNDGEESSTAKFILLER